MERLRQDGLISTSEQAENPLISWYSLTTHDCYYSMMYRFKTNGHTVGYALIFHCAVHPRTNYLYLMNIVAETCSYSFSRNVFPTGLLQIFTNRYLTTFWSIRTLRSSNMPTSSVIFRI